MNEPALKSLHQELGAKFTSFGGWLMPLSYSGTAKEHLACRNRGVIFDVSHLGTVVLRGSNAFDIIQKSFTNDLNKIRPGRAQYSHLLNEAGGVIDDVIIWWIKQDLFHVIPNATNTENVLKVTNGQDITKERVLLAIQGPLVKELFSKFYPILNNLKKNDVTTSYFQNEEVIISGTGYTGEDGFEIACSKELATKIYQQASELEIIAAGLGARDTLRLEAGLPLYGHELKPEVSPLEANLEWVIGWNKDFIGKKALLNKVKSGIKEKLIGLSCKTREPLRENLEVILNGQTIGLTTSGNYSFCLQKGIGFAYIPLEYIKEQNFLVNKNKKSLEVLRSDYPFVKKDPKR